MDLPAVIERFQYTGQVVLSFGTLGLVALVKRRGSLSIDLVQDSMTHTNESPEFPGRFKPINQAVLYKHHTFFTRLKTRIV